MCIYPRQIYKWHARAHTRTHMHTHACKRTTDYKIGALRVLYQHLPAMLPCPGTMWLSRELCGSHVVENVQILFGCSNLPNIGLSNSVWGQPLAYAAVSCVCSSPLRMHVGGLFSACISMHPCTRTGTFYFNRTTVCASMCVYAYVCVRMRAYMSRPCAYVHCCMLVGDVGMSGCAFLNT